MIASSHCQVMLTQRFLGFYLGVIGATDVERLASSVCDKHLAFFFHSLLGHMLLRQLTRLLFFSSERRPKGK